MMTAADRLRAMAELHEREAERFAYRHNGKPAPGRRSPAQRRETGLPCSGRGGPSGRRRGAGSAAGGRAINPSPSSFSVADEKAKFPILSTQGGDWTIRSTTARYDEAPFSGEALTELYRHFDRQGRLLYIGISKSTVQRLASHQQGSRWAGDIVTIKIEYFPDLAAALDAERAAIKREKPIWNFVHNGGQASRIAQATLEAQDATRPVWVRIVGPDEAGRWQDLIDLDYPHVPHWRTVEDAADLTGLDTSTMSELAREDRFPGSQVLRSSKGFGRASHLLTSELSAWLSWAIARGVLQPEPGSPVRGDWIRVGRTMSVTGVDDGSP